MTPEQFKRLDTLFAQGQQVPLPERAAWLELACADDVQVRAELAELLHAGGTGSDRTSELVGERMRMPHAPAPADLGEGFGAYKILGAIGEGGFGVVYLAEQTGAVRRRVALKVLKAGMDSEQVLARFDAERQALALMSHPNVAKVFDGGLTPAAMGSRPYFAMEHVAGVPINEYCDGNKLSIRERLELMVQVCDAIQHAHQKGIIHRDIKPSNILVALEERLDDGGTTRQVPTPKVIDFGIAKAIARPLTDQTLYTEVGQLIGTPAYMSPEQAGTTGLDVDTRTDVYSLGVVLYELIVGALPFDPATLRAAGHQEILRIIREVDPPRPSTRLSSMGAESTEVAARRRMALDRLRSEIKRELEWIPLKAMEKDRGRRYGSAADLARDIQNYLHDRPLLAGPPSRVYQAKKFVRRNRGSVTAAAALAAALVLGVVGTSWGFASALKQRNEAVAAGEREKKEKENAKTAEAEAGRQRDEAVRAKKRADTANEFVIKALRSSDPTQGGQQQTTIVEAMANALKDLDGGAFKDDRETEARLRSAIAVILLNNGKVEESERLAEQALALYQALFDGDHPDVATNLHNVAWARLSRGLAAEAETMLQQSLDMRRRLFEGDHPDIAISLSVLASARNTLGRPLEAETLFQESLDMYRRLYPGDHAEVARGLNNLAHQKEILGHVKQAERLFEEALEMRRRLYKGDHPDVAFSLRSLAESRTALGRAAEAEPLVREAFEMRRRMYQGDHPEIAASLNELAVVLQSLGRNAEAELLLTEAMEMQRRLGRADTPEGAVTLINLGAIRDNLGRAADAEPPLVEALAVLERLYPGDNEYLANCLSSLAHVREGLGRAAEAEPMYERALRMRQRLFPGDNIGVALGLNNLALVRLNLGRPAEAEPLFEQALEMLERLFTGDHPFTASVLNNLALARQNLGRPAAAEPLFLLALEMRQRMYQGNNQELALSLINLAAVQQALGRPGDAVPHYRDALRMLRALYPGDNPLVALCLNNLARCRLTLGNVAEADAGAHESVAMYGRLFKEGHPRRAVAMSTLALVFHKQDKVAEARELIALAEAMVLRAEPPAGLNAGRVLEAKRTILGE